MAVQPRTFEQREGETGRTSSLHRLSGPERSVAAEACVDCGRFGAWGDGQFFYCGEHVPDDLRNRGTTWKYRKA